MSKYETLEEQMFGSSDDDWDDTQTTQETSQLTCDSPLSSGQTGGKGERTVAVRDFGVDGRDGEPDFRAIFCNRFL